MTTFGGRVHVSQGHIPNRGIDFFRIDERHYCVNSHGIFADAGRFAGGGSAALAYDRDAVGNPTCRQDHVNEDLSERYTYDDADRLTTFERGTVNPEDCDMSTTNENSMLIAQQTWDLDGLGNWSTNGVTMGGSEEPVVEVRSHNEANEITTIGEIEPTHDDNGNITYDGSYRYYYDIENRLTKVENADYNLFGEYYYDALGRRVRKTVTNTDEYDGTYWYAWNEHWQLMEVYKAVEDVPTLVQSFVHAGSPSPWYAAMGVRPSALPYVDDHVAMIKANGTYYFYHTDAQFNTLALTRDDGGVAATYVESPYGVLESFTVAGGGGLGGLATNNAMLHQGLMYDVESGTYYNRWRQYLPHLGRFGQRDPINSLQRMRSNEGSGAGTCVGPYTAVSPRSIETPQDAQAYQAYHHSPIAYIDPSGLTVLVSYQCYLVSETGSNCGRHCEYRCFKQSCAVHPGGDPLVDCEDRRIPPMVTHGEDIKGWCITIPVLGEEIQFFVARHCKKTKIINNLFGLNDIPSRNCSRSNWAAGCSATYDLAKEVCDLIPDPVSRKACKLAARVARDLCVDWGNAYCLNP